MAANNKVRINDVYTHEELSVLLADRSDKETSLRAERRVFSNYQDNVVKIMLAIRGYFEEDLPTYIHELRGVTPVYRCLIGLEAEDKVSFSYMF